MRQKMGMVFQSYDLFPHKTILENILLEHGEIVEESRDPKAFFEMPETERARQFLKSFEY